MSVKPGEIATTISMKTGDLRARLRRAAAAVVEPEVQTVYRGVAAGWPVDTGRSLADLAVQSQTGDPDKIVRLVGFVGTSSKYIRFIRSSKVGKQKNATLRRAVYTALVRLPTLNARKVIVKKLPTVLIDEVKRGK